ncbi:hypothetical protein B9G55_11185 [Saccharibacillus sp. O16]|nr:hypothetical protein B9G55_11185 [Saccharibacillus sp. O16]
MRIHIKEQDVLEKEHVPVMTFFNTIQCRDFVSIVEQMALGIGIGINVVACCFPGDVEEEERFCGVMFSLHDNEVILSYQNFFYYLSLACENYLNNCSDDKNVLSKYLRAIQNKYHV